MISISSTCTEYTGQGPQSPNMQRSFDPVRRNETVVDQFSLKCASAESSEEARHSGLFTVEIRPFFADLLVSKRCLFL